MIDGVNQPSLLDRVKVRVRRRPWLYGVLGTLGAAGLLLWSCQPPRGEQAPGVRLVSRDERSTDRDLVYLAGTLETLEEFHPAAVAQQLVQQLNQWLGKSRQTTTWRPDVLVHELIVPALQQHQPPLDLRRYEPNVLRHLEFFPFEGDVLQEAVWLRDIANSVARRSDEPLQRAVALFDWTVRHIHADTDGGTHGQLPWHTLMLGRGDLRDRAWVFMLLARQQGLTVAMLELRQPPDGSSHTGSASAESSPRAEPVPDAAAPSGAAPAASSPSGSSPAGSTPTGSTPTASTPTASPGTVSPPGAQAPSVPAAGAGREWIPALLLGNELYLFEHRLGTPVPGPGGQGVATLAQARADPAVLRQLDLPGYRYPVTAEQLQQQAVYALLDFSPTYLSRRFELLEDHIRLAYKHYFQNAERDREAAERRIAQSALVLSVSPSRLKSDLEHTGQVAGILPWAFTELSWTRVSQQQSAPGGLQAFNEQFAPFLISADVVQGSLSERTRREAMDNLLGRLADSQPQDAVTMPGSQPQARQETTAVLRVLWRARLQHFRGKLTGENGANWYYQLARPADFDLENVRRQAARLEQELRAAQGQAPPDEYQELARRFSDLQYLLRHGRNARELATYWLGIVQLDRHDYQAAVNYLGDGTLGSGWANGQLRDGPWTAAARYRLARALEAQGRISEAQALYEADDHPVQRPASLYRVKQLKSAGGAAVAAPSSAGSQRTATPRGDGGSQPESAPLPPLAAPPPSR
jgi:hypothetical protein